MDILFHNHGSCPQSNQAQIVAVNNPTDISIHLLNKIYFNINEYHSPRCHCPFIAKNATLSVYRQAGFSCACNFVCFYFYFE